MEIRRARSTPSAFTALAGATHTHEIVVLGGGVGYASGTEVGLKLGMCR